MTALPISQIPVGIPRALGTIVGMKGPLVLCRLPLGVPGDICEIRTRDGGTRHAQIVSFEENTFFLSPLEEKGEIFPGAAVTNTALPFRVKVHDGLLGSVIDALGTRLDDGRHEPSFVLHPIDASPPPPLDRKEISEILVTGVRSLDALCPIGHGQRLGLFAEAGVGKSTLLGMIARNSNADVNVIALIGERGREVNDFIKEVLGRAGLEKSVVVVSTSDESPLRRYLAAATATTIAEYFRDQGKKVLLLVDSLTRFARAVRDMSLSAGEMPVRQGYTPRVYSELPKLIERAGPSDRGYITGIYTILSHGEGDADPLSDELRSLLDGHIVLRATVFEAGIRPAIDFTSSVSRLMAKFHDQRTLSDATAVVKLLSRLKRDKDVVLFGGIPDSELKAALALEKQIHAFLSQPQHSFFDIQHTRTALDELVQSYHSFRESSAEDRKFLPSRSSPQN